METPAKLCVRTLRVTTREHMQARREYILELRAGGHTMGDIAVAVGASIGTVHSVITKYGDPIQRSVGSDGVSRRTHHRKREV